MDPRLVHIKNNWQYLPEDVKQIILHKAALGFRRWLYVEPLRLVVIGERRVHHIIGTPRRRACDGVG